MTDASVHGKLLVLLTPVQQRKMFAAIRTKKCTTPKSTVLIQPQAICSHIYFSVLFSHSVDQGPQTLTSWEKSIVGWLCVPWEEAEINAVFTEFQLYSNIFFLAFFFSSPA